MAVLRQAGSKPAVLPLEWSGKENVSGDPIREPTADYDPLPCFKSSGTTPRSMNSFRRVWALIISFLAVPSLCEAFLIR